MLLAYCEIFEKSHALLYVVEENMSEFLSKCVVLM